MEQKPVESLQKFVQSDSLRGEMVKVLPKHITAERFARIAWTAIVRNPALAQCERNSLATAIILCAQAGLEPDGRLAHLVPFGNKVQVLYDYKGLVTLAKRNGVDVKASLIYSGDRFEYLEDDGAGKTVVHHSFNPCQKRGDIIGVYSRAKEDGKDPDYEFMSIEEVEAIRERSRAKNGGPWQTDYGEMVKKTVIKRHSKRWDLLPEIRDVINAEDDTPPPLNQVAVSRPMFSEQSRLENGTEPKDLSRSGPERDEGQTAVPEPSVPPATVSPVKTLRELCKKDKVKESVLIGFLTEIGSLEAGIDSLEQAQLQAPQVLGMAVDQWSDISKRILEATNSGV